jgi:hypothetical protein
MEFFLLFILAFFIGAVHGWNLREQHAKKFIESLAESAQEEEDDNVVKIFIEQHKGQLFAYLKDNSRFIAQASTRNELEQKLNEAYPGKRFGVSHTNLLEIGFIS